MNQHVDAALRGALERTAEGLDDNPERYDQVAARVRRKRQRLVLAGAAGAVLLVTGSVVLAAGRPEPEEVVIPAGGVPEIDCPPPSTTAPELGRVADSDLPLVPEGAIGARACGVHDVTLYQDLDRLVSTLNALPVPMLDLNGSMLCLAIGGPPPFDLVLAYPDGSRVTVWIEREGCFRAMAGGRQRVQEYQVGQSIEDLFRELVEAQEAGRTG